MLEVAICCERISELEHLYYMAEGFRMRNMDLVVRCRRFHSLYDLIGCIREERRFHIYLLDHRSESWMGGPTAEALLRREDAWGAIVGITANQSEAFTRPLPQDRLRLSARLLKPVGGSTLEQVLGEIVDRRYPEQHHEGPRLNFPTTRERVLPPFRWEDRGVRVPYANISYISYKTHAFTLRMINGELLRSSSTGVRMDELTRELLEEPSFLRLPRSVVVNMDHVERLDKALCAVIMEGGYELPVTRRGWDDAEVTLKAYLRQRRRPFFAGGEPR